ncbi:MAG: hypothetical protein ACRDQZ_19720, partial [Mycobacteriales bacterium]
MTRPLRAPARRPDSGARRPVGSAGSARRRPSRPAKKGWKIGSIEVFTVLLIAVMLLRKQLVEAFASPAMQTWATVFVAIVVQA